MADPYNWDYTDEDGLTDSDIFSDVGLMEDKAIKLAIQNSLEVSPFPRVLPTQFTHCDSLSDPNRVPLLY